MVLQPLPNVDPIFALRRLLKFALRSCGLRCLRLAAHDALELEASTELQVAREPGHTRKNRDAV